MDLREKNRQRLNLLDQVPGEARRACALGRLIDVEENDEGEVGIVLDFWDGDGPGGVKPFVPKEKSDHPDLEVRAALNGESLRVLDLPGLKDVLVGRIVARHLDMTAKDVRALIKQPGLARAVELDLGGAKIGAALKNLAQSPNVTDLRRLDLSGTKAKVAPLTEASTLARLEHIDLSGNQLKSQDLMDLVRAESLPALRGLGFRSNRLDDAGLRELAASEALGRINHLNLALNRGVSPEGWKALAESEHLANLRSLDLSAVSLMGAEERLLGGALPRCEELKLLLGSTAGEIRLPALRRLRADLASDNVLAFLADQAAAFSGLEELALGLYFGLHDLSPIAELLGSDALKDLRSLEIEAQLTDPDLLAPLFALPALPALRRLRIAEAPIAPRHLEELASWPGLSGLEELSVTGDLASDAAVALAASGSLEGLTRLDLHLATGSPRLVIALASNPALAGLQSLRLPAHSATGPAFEALAASPHLTNLVELTLDPHGEVTVEQARALYESPNLPNLWIARGVVATGDTAEAKEWNQRVSRDPERRT